MAVSRRQMVDKLETPVDLLIVGGGITGTGIARDAAARGLRVALVEMGDIASGTSSRSSKLVHGGLRYLEHYEFNLVFEAVSERRILMDLAPHLVNPLGFIFPVYEGSRHKLWFIEAGMWIYDGLSLFRSPKLHQTLRAEELRSMEPALEQKGLRGAPLYYDCSTDDARLTLETALDAASRGAVIATYNKVERFIYNAAGAVSGAVVRDSLDGSVREVTTSAVVNATGPWTDDTLALGQGAVSSQEPTSTDMLRCTKGVHVVVSSERLPVQHAVVCLHPKDERVLFAIPWGSETYLGTTDTDFSGDPADVRASREDVAYLLQAAAHYFPAHPLAEEDVISTWAGVRPLIAPPAAEPGMKASSVSREHHITVADSGMITIAGGKLTTYRKMAEEVVDKVVERLTETGFDRALTAGKTDKEPLLGGKGWPASDDHDAVAAEVRSLSRGAISPQSARSLADRYGMRALQLAKRCAASRRLAKPLVVDRPEIVAEVGLAVEEELAATLGDFLERRTQIYYRTRDQGIAAAAVVAELMAPLLGWSEEEQRHQLDRYRAEAHRAQAWRQDDPPLKAH